MFLSVRKRRRHSAGHIRKRQTSFLTYVAFSVLSGVFQRLSGHFPASHMEGAGRWTEKKNQCTKLQPIIEMDKLVFNALLDCFLPSSFCFWAIFADAAERGGGRTVWSQPSPIVLKLGKYTWEHMSVNILTECCDIPVCTPPRPPLPS